MAEDGEFDFDDDDFDDAELELDFEHAISGSRSSKRKRKKNRLNESYYLEPWDDNLYDPEDDLSCGFDYDDEESG